jgi:hypothetical protein
MLGVGTGEIIMFMHLFFRTGYTPKITKYKGKYQDAEGTLLTPEIGPASKWDNLNFEIESNGSAGSYKGILYGLNKNSNSWDTLYTDLQPNHSITNINTTDYDKMKVGFTLRDTTFGTSNPLRFKKLNVDYLPLQEVILSKSNIKFIPDTILQGFSTDLEVKVQNMGYTQAENVRIKLFLNEADSAVFIDTIAIFSDSTHVIKHSISTSNLIFDNSFKVEASVSGQEFYSFNNLAKNSFFVARDSLKPSFNITFDGKEIVNGDIISAKPEIIISLKDNSPLPLDTTLFTIIFDNIPLSFSRSDLQHTYTPYPNSEFKITWNPTLKDGRHTLEVLAKDASGNFFDTTSIRIVFFVYNQSNLLYVYNYPNPFKSDTYFTFELRGSIVPDEFLIKIYTVAGRLIKEISVPSSQMNIGFNKIYWDGRDEDGDDVGNGIYFYKIISRLNNETKVITQKLAKVK